MLLNLTRIDLNVKKSAKLNRTIEKVYCKIRSKKIMHFKILTKNGGVVNAWGSSV